MNTIEVNLHVNISLNEDVKSFFTELFGHNHEEQIAKSLQEQPAKQIAKSLQEQPAKQPVKQPEKPSQEQPAKQPESKNQSSITIEDVRSALMQKVNEHRDAIKNKLNDLGAKSVTSLDPSKYEEMFDYLNSL